MSKDKKDRFLKTPHYQGGNAAMKTFITENLCYPKAALDEKVEGTVFLKYDIDYKGNVVSADVKSGIGHGCDAEATRLVKLLKFEVPKNRKLRVLFHKTIQIHFRLPKEKPAPMPTPVPKPTPVTEPVANEFQYNYITKAAPKAESSKEVKKTSKGYTYTVNI